LDTVVRRLIFFCFAAVIAKQLPHTAKEKNGPGANGWLDAVNWRKAGADGRPARNWLHSAASQRKKVFDFALNSDRMSPV